MCPACQMPVAYDVWMPRQGGAGFAGMAGSKRPADTFGEVRGGTTQGEGRVPTSAESWWPEAPRLPPAPGRTIPPNPLLNADRVAMA